MCNFFTCIVTRAGTVLYTEEDSHDTVIKRSGLIDDLKTFVRIEYTPISGYIIDEKSIPEWYERMAAKAKCIVMAAYTRVIAAHNVLQKVQVEALKEYRAKGKVIRCGFSPDGRDDWGPVCTMNWHKYVERKRAAQEIYKMSIYNLEGYLAPTSERL